MRVVESSGRMGGVLCCVVVDGRPSAAPKATIARRYGKEINQPHAEQSPTSYTWKQNADSKLSSSPLGHGGGCVGGDVLTISIRLIGIHDILLPALPRPILPSLPFNRTHQKHRSSGSMFVMVVACCQLRPSGPFFFVRR